MSRVINKSMPYTAAMLILYDMSTDEFNLRNPDEMLEILEGSGMARMSDF